jgi:UDP-N-acetyl-D-glucosamine dehydrogenase
MVYSISPEGEKFKLPEEQITRRNTRSSKNWLRNTKQRAVRSWWSWASGSWAPSWRESWRIRLDKKTGKPNKLVIGMQRPSTRSFWKIPLFNRGVSPVKAEDPEVAPLIETVRHPKENPGCDVHL